MQRAYGRLVSHVSRGPCRIGMETVTATVRGQTPVAWPPVKRRPSDYPPPVKVREFVAEPQAADDERIDVGVLFVGGGPAGLAGAIRLGQLLADDPATAEIGRAHV